MIQSDAQAAAGLDGAAFLRDLLVIGGQVALANAGVKPAQNVSGVAVSTSPASTTAPVASLTPDTKQAVYIGGAVVVAGLLLYAVLKK